MGQIKEKADKTILHLVANSVKGIYVLNITIDLKRQKDIK
jgi:hypothetical protein